MVTRLAASQTHPPAPSLEGGGELGIHLPDLRRRQGGLSRVHTLPPGRGPGGGFLALALLFSLGAHTPADDKKPDTSTKVTGVVIVPKDVASFDGRVLELRLYTTEKNVADKPADLIEKVEIKDFTHVMG